MRSQSSIFPHSSQTSEWPIPRNPLVHGLSRKECFVPYEARSHATAITNMIASSSSHPRLALATVLSLSCTLNFAYGLQIPPTTRLTTAMVKECSSLKTVVVFSV